MSNSLSKFGAIGDVHAEAELLATAVAHLRAHGVDRILVVGDIVDGSGDVDACADILAASDIAVVRGNHERWFLGNEMRKLPDATVPGSVTFRTQKFLSELPPRLSFATPRGQLLLCHGLGDHDMVGVRKHDSGYALSTNDPLQQLLVSDTAWVVNGHTHEPGVRIFPGQLTVINAGTLQRPYGAGFLLADLHAGYVQYFVFAEDGSIHIGERVPV